MSRGSEIELQVATAHRGNAAEQQRLQPDVVDEPLDVAQVRHRGRDRGVHHGGAVARDVEAVGGGKSGAPEPLGVPGSAGDVELQTVDDRAEPTRVEGAGRVLPGVV